MTKPMEQDIPNWALGYDARPHMNTSQTADTLVLTYDSKLREVQVLTIIRDKEPFRGLRAFPGGFVDADADLDCEAAARRELREETSLDLKGRFIKLGQYDRNGRDPRQFAGVFENGAWVNRGTRVFSTVHLALVRKDEVPAPRARDDARKDSARWLDIYSVLPWERSGSKEAERMNEVLSALEDLGEDLPEGVAGRFRLAHEGGRLAESGRDRWGRQTAGTAELRGEAMAFDHRQMLADALDLLRLNTRGGVDMSFPRMMSPHGEERECFNVLYGLASAGF